MLRLFRNQKAQSTAEYAIVIGLVVAAAIAMQIYIKRGIQAKIKDGTDLLTSINGTIENFTLASTEQYEPYYMGSDFDVSRNATTAEATFRGGGVTRGGNETSWRTGTQIIANVSGAD